jgi:hypothetical protein
MARWLKLVVLCGVAAGTAGVGRAESAPNKPVRLQLKFTEGQRLNYEMVVDTTVATEGQEGKVAWTQTLDLAWLVRSVDKEGAADVTETLERMRLQISENQADSAKNNQGGPLAELMGPVFSAIVNKPIRMKVAPTGVISNVQLPAGMTEELKQAVVGQLAAMFSDDYLKQLAQAASPEFSAKPVSVGQTWTSSRETTNPAYGKQTIKTTYKYEGVEQHGDQKLAKISPQIEVTSAAAKNAEITTKIEKQSSSGAIYLDVEAGKFMESNIKSTMTLNVTFRGRKSVQDLEMVTAIKLMPPRKAPRNEVKKSKTTQEAADEPEEK